MKSALEIDAGQRAYVRAFGTAAALDAFQRQWCHDRKWGYRFTATLPPMTALEAQEARAMAHDRYWGAETFAPYGEYQQLLAATVAAIGQAAQKPDKRAALRQQIEARDGPDCWICGQAVGRNWSVEHYLPRSAGGTDDLENLRLAHPDCNHRLGRLPVAAKDAVRAVLTTQKDDEQCDCDGDGRIWNNADKTSGMWFACSCGRGEHG